MERAAGPPLAPVLKTNFGDVAPRLIGELPLETVTNVPPMKLTEST
jgi:hypothetical protein